MKKVALYSVVVVAFLAALLLMNQGEALALDENGCLSCHSNEDLFKTDENGDRISLYVSEEEVNTASHRFIDCTTCHSMTPHAVDTPLNKLSLAEKCGTCHEYQYKLHKDSIHGQLLAQGDQEVATCVDCHSMDSNPHSVIRVLEAQAPTYKKNIADTCARCHDNEELMASYGIVERVYESYMSSFHGKALQLSSYEVSQLDKATCTNCHGAHDIRAVTDPNSPVAGIENLARTCDQEGCHPGAGVEFAAGFLGHKEASPQNIPVAHYTELVFTIILYSVVGFGAIVVLLAIIRFTLNRWRNES